MRHIIAILITAAVLFSAAGCEKKEEKAASKAPATKGPLIDTPSTEEAAAVPDPETGVTITVPDDVKEKWVYVVIEVEDRKENKKDEYTAFIGGKFSIPDSDLTVNIGPFLPDFHMDGKTITSRSADPKNPAVAVSVEQDGKQIFPTTGKWGWIYGNFPQVHAFQHERYTLTLKGARFRDEEKGEQIPPIGSK